MILPAGNGNVNLRAYIGFKELKQAGVINYFPKLIGIQAAHCAPLAEAFAKKSPTISPFQKKNTLAEGISIANPARASQMLQYVQESQGNFLTVEEPEIKEALHELGQRGFYIEPTSAAVFAGVKKYVNQYAQTDEQIVSVLTGNGLKSTDKIVKVLG